MDYNSKNIYHIIVSPVGIYHNPILLKHLPSTNIYPNCSQFTYKTMQGSPYQSRLVDKDDTHSQAILSSLDMAAVFAFGGADTVTRPTAVPHHRHVARHKRVCRVLGLHLGTVPWMFEK